MILSLHWWVPSFGGFEYFSDPQNSTKRNSHLFQFLILPSDSMKNVSVHLSESIPNVPELMQKWWLLISVNLVIKQMNLPHYEKQQSWTSGQKHVIDPQNKILELVAYHIHVVASYFGIFDCLPFHMA